MDKLNLILCTDVNGGISRNNKIPWNVTEDKTYFRDLINKKPVNTKNIYVMGRKTYDEMKGLIKDNFVILLTNSLHINQDNIYIVNNCDEIVPKINELDNNNIYKIFILGGKVIYDYFLHICQMNYNYMGYFKMPITIYWTEVQDDYQCDNLVEYNFLTNFKYKHNDNDKNRLICYDYENNKEIIIDFYKPIKINIDETENNQINKDEENYINLMKELINTGVKEKCRNGYTYSLFGNILTFNLDRFPLLTTKKTFLAGIFEELMFFIRGETDAKKLSDKGVKIWDKNTSLSFLDKCNLQYEEGDMGPMYGFQWRHFNAKYLGKDKDYSNQGFDQLSYVINLLKTDPKSRRIIMTTFNPAMASQGVLFPCHGVTVMFHANFIDDNLLSLDIMQTQRSCDYFLGVPFNIASYALLVYMLCHVINNDDACKYKYKPGKFIMNLGDYHLYEQHIEQAKKQILRVPEQFPTLIIKNKIYNIEDFKFEDIEINDYNFYPAIKAEMIE